MVHAQDSDVSRGPKVTEWVGVVLFAGILLATVGFFNLIEGFIALFRDDFYLVRSNGLVVSFDYTVWGWILLVSAVLLMGTGWGVVAGKTWARVAAIIIFVDSLLNMLFCLHIPSGRPCHRAQRLRHLAWSCTAGTTIHSAARSSPPATRP